MKNVIEMDYDMEEEELYFSSERPSLFCFYNKEISDYSTIRKFLESFLKEYGGFAFHMIIVSGNESNEELLESYFEDREIDPQSEEAKSICQKIDEDVKEFFLDKQLHTGSGLAYMYLDKE